MQPLLVFTTVSLGLLASALAGEGPSVKFADCPAEVKKTLQAEAAGARIEFVRREKDDDGEMIYWADVAVGGRHYAIGVFEDGTLSEMSLAVDDAELGIDQCPAAVRSTMRNEAFGEKIGNIDMDVKYGVTIFETTVLHHGKSYEIVVAEDGTLVEKVLVIEDEEIDLARCPAVVQTSLHKHAAGGTIHDVTRSTGIHGHTFEAEVEIKSKIYVIEVAENGQLISKSLEAGED
jgi:hypothetical protein